jgi:hypothetical protein
MKQVTSIRQLAKAVGRSPSRISAWIRDDRWPFPRRGPWDADTIQQIKRWAQDTLAPNLADPPPAERVEPKIRPAEAVRLLLGKRKAENIELKNQALRGELHSVAECRARNVQKIVLLKRAVFAMFRSTAPHLEGLPAHEIESILEGRFIEICQAFARPTTDTPEGQIAVATRERFFAHCQRHRIDPVEGEAEALTIWMKHR